MKILIAEDTLTSRRLLQAMLEKAGYEVVSTSSGEEAWEVIQSGESPQLLILDWVMPGMSGIEVCEMVRNSEGGRGYYIILLTGKTEIEDVVEGLEAGADDYLKKPFEKEELNARIRSGERVLELRNALLAKVVELQQAVDHIKTLQGILPVCMYCRKVSGDDDIWQQMEVYVEQHSDAEFSHVMCPDCRITHHPELAEELSDET